MLDKDFIIVFLSSIVTIIIVINVFINRLSMKNRELKKELEIREMRSYLEKQIYEINRKMSSSEDSWRDMNHLVISGQNKNNSELDKNQSFLQNFGINTNDIKVKDDYIFVLMPFNNIYLEQYNIIKRSCEDLGFRCSRGDEKIVEGDLLHNILAEMLKAKIVISVIDGRNPNVFYELGIAHALNKRTLLISSDFGNVPVDLQSKNIIFFEDLESLESKIKYSLPRMLINNE